MKYTSLSLLHMYFCYVKIKMILTLCRTWLGDTFSPGEKRDRKQKIWQVWCVHMCIRPWLWWWSKGKNTHSTWKSPQDHQDNTCPFKKMNVSMKQKAYIYPVFILNFWNKHLTQQWRRHWLYRLHLTSKHLPRIPGSSTNSISFYADPGDSEDGSNGMPAPRADLSYHPGSWLRGNSSCTLAGS